MSTLECACGMVAEANYRKPGRSIERPGLLIIHI